VQVVQEIQLQVQLNLGLVHLAATVSLLLLHQPGAVEVVVEQDLLAQNKVPLEGLVAVGPGELLLLLVVQAILLVHHHHKEMQELVEQVHREVGVVVMEEQVAPIVLPMVEQAVPVQ